MTKRKTIKNYGKSVKERLLNNSRDEHYSSQLLLSRYFQERLLYRLSISEYRDRFILKGGALLYAHDGFQARPTLDIDFMARRISNDEVDFVLRKKGSVVAIEVKSNAEKNTEGLKTFKEKFHPHDAFIVGEGGISAEDFLSMDLQKLF